MYYSHILVDRIKLQAKIKNVLVKDMLPACDLNVNALNQITDKKGLSSFSLAKIADYLDCSTDYLLGRTEDAIVHQALPADGDVVKNNQSASLLSIFNNLDPIKQAKLLVYADELKNN